jgi:hypothetical protein
MAETPVGQLPQSNALAQAGSGAESIAELLSRDPEGYQSQDLDRIIEIMRDQRQRWMAAEAQGGSSPRTKPGPGPKVPQITKASISDIGL